MELGAGCFVGFWSSKVAPKVLVRKALGCTVCVRKESQMDCCVKTSASNTPRVHLYIGLFICVYVYTHMHMYIHVYICVPYILVISLCRFMCGRHQAWAKVLQLQQSEDPVGLHVLTPFVVCRGQRHSWQYLPTVRLQRSSRGALSIV